MGARLLPAALAVLVLGCGQTVPVSPEAVTGPIRASAADQGFRLTATLPADRFAAGQAIDVATELVYEGPNVGASIWSSGSGPVFFALEQLDGPLEMGGGMNLDCSEHELRRGVPLRPPFSKSGGFTAEDPNAEFYRRFYVDPALRLPAGRWRVKAIVSGLLAPCDANAPSLEFDVALDITVVPI